MARLVAGTVVVIPFPFSDLSEQKKRPALILGDSDYRNYITCQITSQKPKDHFIELTNAEISGGELPRTRSYIRYRLLFTASPDLIIKEGGIVSDKIINETLNRVIEHMSSSLRKQD